MQYSKLVLIKNMADTLHEASAYLCNCADDVAKKEITESGIEMIGQIIEIVNANKADVKEASLVDTLETLKNSWNAGNMPECSNLTLSLGSMLVSGIRYKVKAVFFAELGGKWDSMESVYWYMEKDDRFDTEVVLTPIYRVVNKDGKQEAEVIYKDYLTEMGIPFKNYNEYNPKKDAPDLVFMCQPYESCTPREFWAETASKYARVVYLPYYIPGLLFKHSRQTICQLPVYAYAWKVAGISENNYLYYSKYSAKHGANMIVTGAPKLDSVVNLKVTDSKQYDVWKKIKGNRKCILWNTWYDFQNSSIGYFNDIIKWLEDHNDWLLIWRPHPMTDSVTKLYYPDEIKNLYNSCIEKALHSDNIILDKEASYEPSFLLSDCMISDYSSLMIQYIFQDKPVLWAAIKDKKYELEDIDIVDCSFMDKAYDFDHVKKFLEEVNIGDDVKRKIRNEIKDRDLSLANGHAGERVVEAVWKDMHYEDGMTLD